MCHKFFNYLMVQYDTGKKLCFVFKTVDMFAVHQTKIDVMVDLLSILLNCVGMCALDDSQCTSFFLWPS